MKRRNKLFVLIGICLLLFCSFKINKIDRIDTTKAEINPWPQLKKKKCIHGHAGGG